MQDVMLRILAKEAGVRGFACLTTTLAQEAQDRHQLAPTAGAVLAQGLTAGLLMGAQIKVGQSVALKFEGRGAVRKLVAEADNFGRVRGYVTPNEIFLPVGHDPEDVAAAIGGLGLLTVVKDVKLKELHEGIVPLQTGRVDADLVYYLMQSEQTPSLVEIDAKLGRKGTVAAAGGLLFQMLPNAEIENLRQISEQLEDVPPLGEMLLEGQTPETIIRQVLHGFDYEILESYPLRFACSCSRQRSAFALAMIGRAELQALIDEGEAVVDCHFCHERYVFERAALELILKKGAG